MYELQFTKTIISVEANANANGNGNANANANIFVVGFDLQWHGVFFRYFLSLTFPDAVDCDEALPVVTPPPRHPAGHHVLDSYCDFAALSGHNLDDIEEEPLLRR